MNWVLLSAVIGLVWASLIAYPILTLLKRLNSRQVVSEFAPEGHQAKTGTPTMGGIIIIKGGFVGLFCAIIFGSSPKSNLLTIALILITLFSLIGLVDDYVVPRMIKGKRGLGWIPKLILQFVCCVPLAWAGFSTFDAAVLALIVVAFSNAYNFSDGLDFLAAGLGIPLLALSAFVVGPELAAAPAAVLGAMIPFGYLNKPKAKVFMGDVGSLPIGALIGLMFGIAMLSNSRTIGPIALASIVMMAELLPVPIQIFSVKVFKRKVFPYTPIHHAFEKGGIPEVKVMASFVAVQLACVVGAYMWLR